jgi:hypothetical protein
LRRRYFLLVSVAYIALGLIIAGRSVVAHVPGVAILGIVLVALGAVRIRGFLARNDAA